MSSDWIETTLSLKKDQILREVEPEVDESRQIDPSKTSYEMCTENGEGCWLYQNLGRIGWLCWLCPFRLCGKRH